MRQCGIRVDQDEEVVHSDVMEKSEERGMSSSAR